MKPRIENIAGKKLMGKRSKMSFSNNKNKTFQLWHGFMKRRKEIKNTVNTDLYSIQVFDKSLEYKDFSPNTEFEKWAVVEVTDFDNVPSGMETHVMTGGKYAVFIHQGAADTFYRTSQYIFETWLPDSKYVLDDREHFEILSENYDPNDKNAEEEVWIPVK